MHIDPDSRAELNKTQAQRFDPETGKPVIVSDESLHFFTCDYCGDPVDCRLLGDVIHHSTPDHTAEIKRS